MTEELTASHPQTAALTMRVMFVCKYCHKSFRKGLHLIYHKKHVHPIEVRHVQAQRKWRAATHRGESVNGQLNTNDFDSKQQLQKVLANFGDNAANHVGLADKFRSISKIKIESSSSAFEEQKVGNNLSNNLICRFCNKSCQNKTYFMEHEQMHLGQRPYKCKYCLRSFTWSGSCFRHQSRCPESKNGEVKNRYQGSVPSASSRTTKSLVDPSPIAQNSMGVYAISKLESVESNPKRSRRKRNLNLMRKRVVHPCLTPLRINRTKMYRCNVCKKEIYNLFEATRHARMHTGEKPFKCLTCGLFFVAKRSLKRHELRQHTESPAINIKLEPMSPESTFVCQFCQQVFSKPADFFLHKKRFHSAELRNIRSKPSITALDQRVLGPLKLKQVTTKVETKLNKKLSLPREAETCESDSESNPLQDLSCRFCEKSFTTKYYRIEHEKLAHSEHGSFKCQHCSKSFRWKQYWKRHEQLCIRKRQSQLIIKRRIGSNQSVNATSYFNRLKINGKSLYKCIFCAKLISNKTLVESHINNHTGERPYKCLQCNLAFTSVYSLNRHEKNKHSESAIKIKTELKSETKSVSMPVVETSRSRSTSSVISKQLQSSTATRRTTTTGRIGTSAEFMRVNSQSDADDSVSKREATSTADLMKIKEHVRIRTKKAAVQLNSMSFTKTTDGRYCCNVCQKIIWLKPNLRRHLLTHTNYRPFKCSHCYQTFTNKVNLADHESGHFGLKLHVCKHCKKSFRWKSHHQLHESKCQSDD